MRHPRKLILVSSLILQRKPDFVFNVVTEAEQVVPLKSEQMLTVFIDFQLLHALSLLSSLFICCFWQGGSWYKFSEIPRQPPAPAWNMTKYNTNIAYILGHTRQTIPILTFFVQLGATVQASISSYEFTSYNERRHLFYSLTRLKQRWIFLPNGFDCLPPKSGAWLEVTQITETQTHSHAHTHTTHILKAVSHIV